MTFEDFAAGRLPAVLKFAAVLTGDRGLAEDVVQEVLIRTSARWQVIGSLPRPEAYVRKMIVNEYLTWRRRSWRLVLSGANSSIEGPVGFQNSALTFDLLLYAARSYSLMRPPRTARRLIRS
jgi:DNA-directed RNA polymerase specialized sigma24 family protein